MTLRRRLVLLVVGLSAVGLVVSGLVGTLLLRSFALNRVDRQLAGGFGPPRFGNRPGGRVTGLIAERFGLTTAMMLSAFGFIGEKKLANRAKTNSMVTSTNPTMPGIDLRKRRHTNAP